MPEGVVKVIDPFPAPTQDSFVTEPLSIGAVEGLRVTVLTEVHEGEPASATVTV